MSLEREFNYYLANQDELVKTYSGRIIAIKGEEVIGVFNSDIEAINKLSQQHTLGTFLVQKCEPGADSYRQTFHSRVLVASC